MATSGEISQLFINEDVFTAGSFVSEWLSHNQASSLIFTVSADSTFYIQVDYAVNSDFVVVDTEILANTVLNKTETITITVKSRYMRFSVFNLANPSVLKCQGFFFNNYLKSTAERNSNQNVKLSSDSFMRSAFGEVLIQSFETRKSYTFDDIIDGDLYSATNKAPQFGGPFRGHNIDLCNASQGVTTDPTVYAADGILHLRTNESTLLTEYHLCSNIVNYVAGVGIEGRGTVYFKQPVTRTKNLLMLTGVYTLSGTFPNQVISDGFTLGFRDPTPLFIPQLCYYRDGVLQTQIPQNDWNGDQGLGLGELGTLDWSKFNLWRLNIGYLGAQVVTWEIASSTGNWVVIHTYKFPNTLTESHTRSTGYRIGAFIKSSTVASTSVDGEICCGSWSLGMDGKTKSKKTTASFSRVVSGITGETLILSLRNNPTWNSRTNTRVMEIDSISIGVDSTGNGTSILKMYRLRGLNASSWLDVDSEYLPISTDITATSFTTSEVPTYSMDLSKSDSRTISLTDTDHNDRNEHYELQPGNYFTFSLESTTSTECRLSLNFNLK